MLGWMFVFCVLYSVSFFCEGYHPLVNLLLLNTFTCTVSYRKRGRLLIILQVYFLVK